MHKQIPIKLPIDLSQEDPFLDEIRKENEAVHKRVMHNMMIAQNKMLTEMMIHHDDYDVLNYDLKFSNEYHADTGCIDMSFYFDYKPSDRKNTEADKFRISRSKHIASVLSFYDDYDLDHYRIEDRVDENGKPYDCRIYYDLRSKNERAMSN